MGWEIRSTTTNTKVFIGHAQDSSVQQTDDNTSSRVCLCMCESPQVSSYSQTSSIISLKVHHEFKKHSKHQNQEMTNTIMQLNILDNDIHFSISIVCSNSTIKKSKS